MHNPGFYCKALLFHEFRPQYKEGNFKHIYNDNYNKKNNNNTNNKNKFKVCSIQG